MGCRGEEWVEGDSDSAEVFVENMSDGYFLPASTKGIVVPGRAVSVPNEIPLWGPPQRSFVPGCLLVDRPQHSHQEGADADASPPASGLPLTLKYHQLDTLLTCVQIASRRFCPQEEDGPSYMTRSRAARSRPGPFGTTVGGPTLQQFNAGWGRFGAVGGHSGHAGPVGTGQLSPVSRVVDSLVVRLKGIVRGMQHTIRTGSRERRRSQTDDPESGAPPVPTSPASSLKISGEELPAPLE